MNEPGSKADNETTSKHKFAWKVFCPQSGVSLHCSDDEKAQDKPHSIQHINNLPRDLRPLAQLVANPETKESVWLNACVAAGQKSLVSEPSRLNKLGSSMLAILGAVLAILVVFFNFIVATLFSSETASLFHGVDPNIFMRSLIDSHLTGVIMAIGASFVFWYSLLIANKKVRRSLVGLSSFLVGAALLLCSIDYLGVSLGIAVSTLGVAFTLFLATMASWCREALPKTFGPAKLAQSIIGTLLLPAALTSFSLIAISSGDYHSTGAYSTPTFETSSIIAGVLFLTIFGQSLALSLGSKSSSRAACALLSTCTQAPLLLGLSFTALGSLLKTITSSASSFLPAQTSTFSDSLYDWSQYGADKVGFTLLAIGFSLLLALSGSYMGASINAWRAKLRS